jgi:pimeloyl-ACP methyl ester carboxylesterase
MNQKINEQVVLLGKMHSLVGVLTRPVVAASQQGPAVVILNTGVVHRVGHHRMYVTMSRVLARAGHTVLRFDFSGIGDSDARSDALPLLDSCLADIEEALDWLEQQHQISRVVIIGLCSGADHALLYGHTDARVVALILLDPTIPATPRYYLHYIVRRLTRLRNWRNLIAGRSRLLNVWAKQLLCATRPELRFQKSTLQDLQFRNGLEKIYRSTVDRNIHMLAVLTEDTTRQTYARQILDAFPNVLFRNLLTTEFFPGSDHLFSLEADRAKLIPLILKWIDALSSKLRAEQP